MSRKLYDLVGETQSVGPPGPGRRYPAGLRERMVAWAEGERRRGRRWREVADDLGVPGTKLTRWCEESPKLVPVVVRPDVSA